ncbi:MAG TPA: DUF4142 domain-containing protein [Dongiaceae bacterium]|nr:DUF4142 domain-containing protein [Dongiaceae bacterium]
MLFHVVLLSIALAVPVGVASPQQASAQEQNKSDKDQLSDSDKEFLKALIQEDTSEIELAQMALQKSSDPRVKDYAQTKILGADPQMRDGAEQIAREAGMQPPTQLNAVQKQMHDELSAKSGKIFENAYMNYEADQQQADVLLAKQELQSTSSSKMKNYVNAQKGPIEQAALSATQISAQISSEMTDYRQPGR